MSDTTDTTSLLVIPVFWSLSNGSKRVVDILASSFCFSFSSTGITTTANAVDYSASLERKCKTDFFAFLLSEWPDFNYRFGLNFAKYTMFEQFNKFCNCCFWTTTFYSSGKNYWESFSNYFTRKINYLT